MASRPSKGRGSNALPTPQQAANFIAALTATPALKSHEVRHVEREVRDDAHAMWHRSWLQAKMAYHEYEAASCRTTAARLYGTKQEQEAAELAFADAKLAHKDAVELQVRIPATTKDRIADKRLMVKRCAGCATKETLAAWREQIDREAAAFGGKAVSHG